MVKLMIGRDLKAQTAAGPRRRRATSPLGRRGIRTATYPGQAGQPRRLRSGEILGLAGLVGSGRTELARAIFGVDPSLWRRASSSTASRFAPGHTSQAVDAGHLPRAGRPQGRRHPARPADLAEHLAARSAAACPAASWFAPRETADRRDAAAQSRHQGAAGVDRGPASLSGGNQQKVVLGKWLAMKPKVMILDEPTRGIDIGAKAEIYGLMRGLADAGVAVLMISSDMEEVIGVSDRIAVMHEGRISGHSRPRSVQRRERAAAGGGQAAEILRQGWEARPWQAWGRR